MVQSNQLVIFNSFFKNTSRIQSAWPFRFVLIFYSINCILYLNIKKDEKLVISTFIHEDEVYKTIVVIRFKLIDIFERER